ncbi:MAG TPA: Fur family transcriptional regulator [Dokdonella sp.]|nr:Fur family transcriptional regulator [Dokdonella sp.]
MIHIHAREGLELAANPAVRGIVSAAVSACAARGVRLTPLRARILELVAQASQPIKAYELLALMRKERGRAGPPTVYRALDFLLEYGLIRKVAAMSAYVVSRQPGDDRRRPLLVCERCGHVTELVNASIERILDGEARARGFRPTSKTIEVQGICAECRVPSRDAAASSR